MIDFKLYILILKVSNQASFRVTALPNMTKEDYNFYSTRKLLILSDNLSK